MNKFVIFLVFLALIISTKAQDYTLEKHIEQGKQAFRKFADTENHKKLKQEREVNAYNIGDSKTFWRWNLSVMPPTWIQEDATCRAVGENSYVFISNTEWNVHINQDDVDLIMFRLEEETVNSAEIGIIEMDTTYFGQIPDELDNDPKVIFFFSALGSYGGSTFDGYFSSYNQMTEAEAVAAEGHSNECEMLYMSCNPVNPSAISTLSVLAHELQHLIHFGYDPNEETWVDEGCAELAMVLFGQPDPIVNFPSEPEDKYNEILMNYQGHFTVTIPSSVPLIDDLNNSSCVVGVESMGLVIALELGKKVFSYKTGKEWDISLPHKEIIHIDNVRQIF